jgi:hypothetical protein
LAKNTCLLQIAYYLLSLSLLKAGVLFVNYIKSALTTHYFTINTALFNRCSNSHGL